MGFVENRVFSAAIKHFIIRAEPLQSLNRCISTYEAAMQRKR